MKISRLALSIGFLVLVPAASLAQHVYPAQGQSQQQQQQDQGECHTWAVNQSGYNAGYAQQPTQGGNDRGPQQVQVHPSLLSMTQFYLQHSTRVLLDGCLPRRLHLSPRSPKRRHRFLKWGNVIDAGK